MDVKELCEVYVLDIYRKHYIVNEDTNEFYRVSHDFPDYGKIMDRTLLNEESYYIDIDPDDVLELTDLELTLRFHIPDVPDCEEGRTTILKFPMDDSHCCLCGRTVVVKESMNHYERSVVTDELTVSMASRAYAESHSSDT